MNTFSPLPIGLALLTLLLGMTGSARSGEPKLFSGKHPHLIAFRGEMIGPTHRSYQTWSEDLRGHSAVIRKFWDEEIDYKPETVEWARRYMKEHPEVSFLWHLNAETRVAHDKPEVLEKYFPGHWALHAGVTIDRAVPGDQTAFRVSNPKIFKEVGFVDRKSGTESPQDLVIVGRDADGGLDWSRCEYATIATVDEKDGSVTVQRGRYGSKALAYGEGGIYIAPIIGSVWAGNRLWFYNHSTTCPRDAAGKNASDVFLGEILAKLDPETGDLRGFDGIAFDIMYWIARVPGMDIDNDGVADGKGIVDGRQVWRDGMLDWLTRLRKAVGPDFLLVSDSGFDKHQRAVGLLNGMEAEGFPFHHDAFRSFSTPINHFAYWKTYGAKEREFNFAAIKYKEPKDLPKATQYARFATGAVTCLDLFATRYTVRDGRELVPIDELTAGLRNEPQWLGKIAGPLWREEDFAPDLLDGEGTALTETFLSKLEVEGGRHSVEDDGILRLRGTADDPHQPIRLTLPDLPRPKGDVVLRLDVRSQAPLAPELAGTPFPRMLSVRVDGLPDYPEASRGNRFFNDLGGAFGTPGFINQRFYFRDLDEAEGETITLHLTFEDQGAVDLKSLRLLAGSQVMAREFENGVVLVNPSFDPKTFDLRKLCPSFKGGYRFLKGRQAPNDGEPVSDPTAVEVPPVDALFLEKESL